MKSLSQQLTSMINETGEKRNSCSYSVGAESKCPLTSSVLLYILLECLQSLRKRGCHDSWPSCFCL